MVFFKSPRHELDPLDVEILQRAFEATWAAIKASGQITRSAVAEVPVKGRDTMGVRFVGVAENDSVVVIALNPETTAEAARLADEAPAGDDSNSTSGVVEDDSSLESALEVRPVTPNGVADDAGVQEDDSE